MGLDKYLIESWLLTKGIHTIDEITEWIRTKNVATQVKINQTSLKDNSFWFYDANSGIITNQSNSFYKIQGVQQIEKGEVIGEQPIIIQNEIGYLGFICKQFDGVLHFLIQAKIEPGNINKVQLSPTIQATKSNFTQKHGGYKPPYLDYFINAHKYEVIVDQLQSEQSSRFYKKRNRNIIIYVDDDIETISSHKWVTLGQIKELLKSDNLVNMDTRTVISCIPFYNMDAQIGWFRNKPLYYSLYNHRQMPINKVFNKMNDYKMFSDHETKFVSLDYLNTWKFTNSEITSTKSSNFKVIFCEIEIEGREVKRWFQPLFKALKRYTFGLITTIDSGILKFLVKLTPEIGCFDKVELGPSIQYVPSLKYNPKDDIESLFLNNIKDEKEILYDVLLSEEGGRFFHEENRNVIIHVDKSDLKEIPDEYVLLDYKTLNHLAQYNNILNIQLRNLLSLLEV